MIILHSPSAIMSTLRPIYNIFARSRTRTRTHHTHTHTLTHTHTHTHSPSHGLNPQRKERQFLLFPLRSLFPCKGSAASVAVATIKQQRGRGWGGVHFLLAMFGGGNEPGATQTKECCPKALHQKERQFCSMVWHCVCVCLIYANLIAD